ncbi:MAG: hypothetical protein U9O98_03490 [Asgard group archaeon]|nr:hypothetical protein [Asgard group archaeon]
MMKDFAKCAVCGKLEEREKMHIYHFPDGPKLVCSDCYKKLPPDPMNRIKTPKGTKRGPGDDLFPPVG